MPAKLPSRQVTENVFYCPSANKVIIEISKITIQGLVFLYGGPHQKHLVFLGEL